MVSIHLSLPSDMKEWVKSQSQDGGYSSASDYVRKLIRLDQNRKQDVEDLKQMIAGHIESRASHTSDVRA